MSELHNVCGRITYISSHAKQENLYAVYETTDRHYWTELARFNQQEFLKSGTEGKCIEARELIIALPESFPDLYNPDKLLQMFTNRFKEKYGVECVSALHHNKQKTNYHIHLIFSERQLLQKPVEKIATRNMFYNEQVKHVRTKKEILDDSGNIRRGCKIIKKGEVYERTLFTAKNKLFHEALEKEYYSKSDVKADNITNVVTTPAMEEITESEPPTVTVTATVAKAEDAEPPKPQIPPRPFMPPEAATFPKLKPCTKRYKGIKKRLIGRMPITLTKAKIKGRDNRPSFCVGIIFREVLHKTNNQLIHSFYLKLPFPIP